MNLRSRDLDKTSGIFNFNPRVAHSPIAKNSQDNQLIDTSIKIETQININNQSTSDEESNTSISESDTTIRDNNGSSDQTENSGTGNINLEDTLEEEQNMAQAVCLKDALRVIPDYDGERLSLTDFFAGLDEAKVMLGATNEANLTRVCRSKLIGEARRSIRKKDFETIDALKNHLKNYFFSNKTVFQLQGELGSLFQGENESVSKFANRVADCGDTLVEVYKLENHPSADQLTAFTNTTLANEQVCFKRGLRSDIEHRLQETNDFDDLVKNAISIERELHAKNSLRQPNHGFNNHHKMHRNKYSASIQNNVSSDSDEEDTEPIGLNYQTNLDRKKVTFKEPKCPWCYGAHVLHSCPLLVDKKEELVKVQNQGSVCAWCLKPGHTLKACWAAQKEFFDIIKLPQTTENSSETKNFCRYCRDPNHHIENCPRRPKIEENVAGSWRNQKNEKSPPVKSEQKGTKTENRSLNWVKIESLEM